MNILLPYARGLDYHIQRLQTRLYEWQLQLSGLATTPDLYRSYGRVYRNNDGNGFIPEYFGSDKYTDGSGSSVRGGMFFDDRIAMLSYFGSIDPIKKENNGDYTAKVELMFFVDLSKITPDGISDAQGQRLDEVFVDSVINFIQFNGCGWTIKDVVKDVDKVLEKYSGKQKNDTLNKDMQPRLCFKVVLETHYNPQLNQSCSGSQRQLQLMQRSIVLYIKTTPNPALLIAVGNGQFIQQEYAPTDVLIPKLASATSGYLAYKTVELPFVYNEQNVSVPDYDNLTGAWTKTGDPTGFQDGDYVTITFTDLS